MTGNFGKRFLKAFLPSLLAAMSIFAVGTTIKQIPDELCFGSRGSSEIQTFLPVEVNYSDTSANTADAKLFGLVKVKDVGIRLRDPAKVMLCGNVFGVKMHSDGVMVTGFSDFYSHGKKLNPALSAGMNEGDVIISVNGVRVYSNKDFADIVTNSSGEICLEVAESNQKRKTVKLTPAYSDNDKCLKTGMWVRDSASGIGTLTYIDPTTSTFGGLGHGICDADTHDIVPVHKGDIVSALIVDIKRGVKGSAGEIRGYLCNEKLGEIISNTQCGTFGEYIGELPQGKLYDVAFKQEVKTGKAQILCTLENDSPKLYDICINKINYSGNEPTKNMMITVTDKELLSKAGGIVQGMSGSPIIQNGKFVGAVTHVFVNEPTCGYAIFAENMVERGSKCLSKYSTK